MKYENIKMVGDADKVRYILMKEGEKPLVVIGINPSTANESRLDPTMGRVMGYAERNGFDSFIMCNVYPQRSTNVSGLHKERNEQLHTQNITEISNALAKVEHPTVLLAFGNNIDIRPWLKECLRDIVDALLPYNPQFVQLGELTKRGNPRHPLYAGNRALLPMDINHFLTK